MSIWDDPDMQPAPTDYVKWDNPGQTIVGTITNIVKGTDFNGAPCPQLELRLDDGTDIALTCGQYQLAEKVKALRPIAGDRILVSFDAVQATAGGRTVKVFTVRATRGGVELHEGALAAPAPAPVPQPAPVPATPGANATLAAIGSPVPAADPLAAPAPAAGGIAGLLGTPAPDDEPF